MRTALLIAGAALASGKTTWSDLATKEYTYEQWLEEFQPKHTGTREIFEANLAEIRAHNANPSHTWKKGVNKVRAARSSRNSAVSTRTAWIRCITLALLCANVSNA
jgi:hypothetical protein